MEEKKTYKKWSNKGKTLNPESLTVNQGRPEPRQRRLASLMSEDAKATASIHELSCDFASIKLYRLKNNLFIELKYY